MTTRFNHKICSPSCYSESIRQQHKRYKIKKSRKCKVCGEPIIFSTGGRKAPWEFKYCSTLCYKKDTQNYVKVECANPNCNKLVWKSPKNKNNVFCTTCSVHLLPYQKCERCGRSFPEEDLYSLCLNCFFDNYATKCLNCGKTLKKNRKRIITEENHNYLLNTLNFNPKKIRYFKISNMQYCDINCAIQKETPYYYKGIADEEYPPEFNRVLKDQIIKRDGSKCQLCPTNFNLAVHHIDYNKQNINPANLITLCAHHHMKTNWNRAYWVNLFSNYQLWRGLL